MKKTLLTLLAAFFLVGVGFAAEAAKVWKLDIYETTNPKIVAVTKNPYAPGYNADSANIPQLTAHFRSTGLPKVGDTVEISYKFYVDVDIGKLDFMIIDNCPDVNYWMALSDTWESLYDLKKGQLYEGTFKFKVDTKPKKEFALEIQNRDERNCKLSLRR